MFSEEFAPITTEGTTSNSSCATGIEMNNNNNNNNNNEHEAIYYFGYGPIVNPIVRYRRGCMILPENIQTAILYDHRLTFVKGGTANIVPSRGWDVKGVLLKFNTPQEWQQFRQFDANYEVRDINVSVIDKTNIDPKKKNEQTAPFEFEEDQEEEETTATATGDCSTQMRVENDDDDDSHQSCPISVNNFEDDRDEDGSSSSEEEYDNPFSVCDDAPKSHKIDPNAIRCLTFMMIDDTATTTTTPITTATQDDTENVVGKPQERYLKLMADGLRAHEIDETYISDEILSVDYIANERDTVVVLDPTTTNANGDGDGDAGDGYRKFPLSTKPHKLPKISFAKYEIKLCKTKNRNSMSPSSSSTSLSSSINNNNNDATYFICGRKVMKLQDNNGGGGGGSTNNINNNNNNNPCVKWLRAQGHGKQDLTLTVHQTFVDPDSLHLPLVDTVDDLTPRHYEWAEHTILLYLERGGLTATVVYELDCETKTNRRTSLLSSLASGCGGHSSSMSSLTASMSMGRFSLKHYRNSSKSTISRNSNSNGVESDLFNICQNNNNNNNNHHHKRKGRHNSMNHISSGGHNAQFPADASSSMPLSMPSGQAAASAADQAKIGRSLPKRTFSFARLKNTASRSSK